MRIFEFLNFILNENAGKKSHRPKIERVFQIVHRPPLYRVSISGVEIDWRRKDLGFFKHRFSECAHFDFTGLK